MPICSAVFDECRIGEDGGVSGGVEVTRLSGGPVLQPSPSTSSSFLNRMWLTFNRYSVYQRDAVSYFTVSSAVVLM